VDQSLMEVLAATGSDLDGNQQRLHSADSAILVNLNDLVYFYPSRQKHVVIALPWDFALEDEFALPSFLTSKDFQNIGIGSYPYAVDRMHNVSDH
jgi:hypothetical protein